MNGEIFNFMPDQLRPLLNRMGHKYTEAELEILERSAKNSRPLLVGIYNNEVLAIIGFIPPSLMADVAYMWMVAGNAKQFSTMFGRHARRVVNNALISYPRIVGHCKADSQRFVKFLGAELKDPRGDLIPFEIKA